MEISYLTHTHTHTHTHTPLRVGNRPNVKCKITKFLEENVEEKLCKFEF